MRIFFNLKFQEDEKFGAVGLTHVEELRNKYKMLVGKLKHV
jgi:hypothetical protein